jgi:hypothetical protein
VIPERDIIKMPLMSMEAAGTLKIHNARPGRVTRCKPGPTLPVAYESGFAADKCRIKGRAYFICTSFVVYQGAVPLGDCGETIPLIKKLGNSDIRTGFSNFQIVRINYPIG